MNFYQLAFRYLARKKSKTVILFFLFALIGSMILSTSIISRATQEAKMQIQEKAGSKVIIEIMDGTDKISEEEMQKAVHLDGVASVNRQFHGKAAVASAFPVTGSNSEEEDNGKASVYSFDDLKNDSIFSEEKYRLQEGAYIDRDTVNGIVVNSYFAEANALKLGDTVQLEAENGELVAFTIVGLFLAGSERKQLDETLAADRIENQMYIDNKGCSELFPNGGFYKASFYVRNPEEIESVRDGLAAIFSDRVDITASDTLFEQMKAPLEQVLSIVNLMFYLTFATGTVIVTILLCMWMRTRKKETSVFVSMGKAKGSILLQVILEAFGVFLASAAGACVAGGFTAQMIEGVLFDAETADISLQMSLTAGDVVSLLGAGSAIICIAVSVSMFPILKANPKDMLSRMEG